jgi:hypothetical protein
LQPRDVEVNGRLAPSLPPSPLAALRTIELGADDEPLLQRFFDENPAYFIAVHGEPAAAGEAHEEIHGLPPAGWSFSKKWLVGYVDGAGSLVAVANVITDLLAPGVWHIGLFIVATSRHAAAMRSGCTMGSNAGPAATGRAGCAWASCGAMAAQSAFGSRSATRRCARAKAWRWAI